MGGGGDQQQAKPQKKDEKGLEQQQRNCGTRLWGRASDRTVGVLESSVGGKKERKVLGAEFWGCNECNCGVFLLVVNWFIKPFIFSLRFSSFVRPNYNSSEEASHNSKPSKQSAAAASTTRSPAGGRGEKGPAGVI